MVIQWFDNQLSQGQKLKRAQQLGFILVKMNSYRPSGSDKIYEQIFYDAHARLIGKVSLTDSNESRKVITGLENIKLKDELKQCKEQNKALIKRMFVVSEGHEELLSENDVLYSKLMSIHLAPELLEDHLPYLAKFHKGQKQVNAYLLEMEIIEKCQKPKK